jgi:UDP-GlcNAc:undecaprenyl-phosphate GlcNAc-1-phosphate transferase
MIGLLAYAEPGNAPESLSPLAVLSPYMGVFFVAFFVAIISTPILTKLATANGIVDWPDLKRKNHIKPVAYLGGIAIFIAWIAGVIASHYFSPAISKAGFPLTLILGAGLITATGLIDDVYGLRARVKLGGQLFAAAALTAQHVGFEFTESLTGAIGLELSSQLIYFLTTFYVAVLVLGGCNAVNLIDGLDGLASGVVAIAMTGFLVIALITAQPNTIAAINSPVTIVLCLATLGAILGFLPYNFNPASIFMGDAGSLLLGFLAVSAILMLGEAGSQALRVVTAALIVFAVPITDTSLAIIRRKMRGQPIMSPDNQHLHHLLRRTGMSVRKAVLCMYSLAVIFALIGILLIALDLQWRYVLAVFFVVYGFIMVTAFKYGSHCLTRDRLRAQALAEVPIPARAPIDQSENGYTDQGVNGDSAASFTEPTSAGNGRTA